MKLRYNHYLCLLLGAMAIASCSDDTSDALSWEIGDGTKIDYPEDYFTGGQLGTTTNNSSTAYKQPSKGTPSGPAEPGTPEPGGGGDSESPDEI